MKNYIFLLLCCSAMYAQKPIFAAAKTKAATVYFSSAEISQTATVALPKGNSEIVLRNVADFLNQNTIRIGAPSGLTIMSVQFTTNYIDEYDAVENSSVVKQVRDSLNIVQKQVEQTVNLKDTEAKVIELLDANQKILGQGSGNLAELMKWMPYYKAERLKAANAFDALEARTKELQLKLESLKNRLEVNAGKADKTSKGKIVLRVMNQVAGNVDLDINYISPNASWTPSYDLRAASVNTPIQTSYKAQIVQSTGIDWKQVKLKLSSGNPSQNNEAPVLSGWFLRYQENEYNLAEVAVVGYGTRKDTAALNSLQGTAPGLTVQSRNGDTNGIDDFTAASENMLNVSFD
ncbi:MAG: mucoidy inhibitor MuiA family protein, partial [Sphingobacteriales bacterium]